MNQHSAQIAAAVVVGLPFNFAIPEAAESLKLWCCFKKPFRLKQMTQLKQYITIMKREPQSVGYIWRKQVCVSIGMCQCECACLQLVANNDLETYPWSFHSTLPSSCPSPTPSQPILLWLVRDIKIPELCYVLFMLLVIACVLVCEGFSRYQAAAEQQEPECVIIKTSKQQFMKITISWYLIAKLSPIRYPIKTPISELQHIISTSLRAIDYKFAKSLMLCRFRLTSIWLRSQWQKLSEAA